MEALGLRHDVGGHVAPGGLVERGPSEDREPPKIVVVGVRSSWLRTPMNASRSSCTRPELRHVAQHDDRRGDVVRVTGLLDDGVGVELEPARRAAEVPQQRARQLGGVAQVVALRIDEPPAELVAGQRQGTVERRLGRVICDAHLPVAVAHDDRLTDGVEDGLELARPVHLQCGHAAHRLEQPGVLDGGAIRRGELLGQGGVVRRQGPTRLGREQRERCRDARPSDDDAAMYDRAPNRRRKARCSASSAMSASRSSVISRTKTVRPILSGSGPIRSRSERSASHALLGSAWTAAMLRRSPVGSSRLTKHQSATVGTASSATARMASWSIARLMSSKPRPGTRPAGLALVVEEAGPLEGQGTLPGDRPHQGAIVGRQVACLAEA